MFRLQEWERDEVRAVFEGLAFRDVWERLMELGGYHAEEAGVREITVTTANSAEQARAVAADGLVAVEPAWDAGGIQGVVAAVGPEAAVFVPEQYLGDFAAAVKPDEGIAAHDAKPIHGGASRVGACSEKDGR